MDAQTLRQMMLFHGEAVKATYAGGAGETASQRPGFIELAHHQEAWDYRDSYTGFLRSWGQEVIAHQGQPIWTNLYGGGMEPEHMSEAFALQTFGFLKKALSVPHAPDVFRPRGPDTFFEDSWGYACSWRGDMTSFSGDEFITQDGKIVFRHQFLGGLIVGEV